MARRVATATAAFLFVAVTPAIAYGAESESPPDILTDLARTVDDVSVSLLDDGEDFTEGITSSPRTAGM